MLTKIVSQEDMVEDGYEPWCLVVDLNYWKMTGKSKYLSNYISGMPGSFAPEDWYYKMYQSFDKKFKKYVDDMSCSDYYTMHFDTPTKEEAEEIEKYVIEYLNKITDKTILDEFSKQKESDKIYGLTEKFWDKFFKGLHS